MGRAADGANEGLPIPDSRSNRGSSIKKGRERVFSEALPLNGASSLENCLPTFLMAPKANCNILTKFTSCRNYHLPQNAVSTPKETPSNHLLRRQTQEKLRFVVAWLHPTARQDISTCTSSSQSSLFSPSQQPHRILIRKLWPLEEEEEFLQHWPLHNHPLLVPGPACTL
jgi:hypothetical protein